MRREPAMVVLLLVASACGGGSAARGTRPAPKLVTPAAAASPPDGEPARAAPSEPPPASPFHLVARAAMPAGDSLPNDYAGHPFPLVQRLAGGGLVVASEYARAQADAGGPLRVELVYEGLEQDALHPHSYINGAAAIRWLWVDGPGATFAIEESFISRVGVSLITHRLGKGGWQVLRRSVGYEAAVTRGGSVLALERVVRTVGKGSDATTEPGRARVGLLAGSGPVPTLPRDFCPSTMSAAADGALLVVGEACGGNAAHDGELRAVRFGPQGNKGIVEALPPSAAEEHPPYSGPVALAVSNDELWLADGSLLARWDGKAWSSTRPFGEGVWIRSLSRSPAGALWAVVHQALGAGVSGRLLTRAAAGTEWKEVPLPPAPLDPLDPEAYTDASNDLVYRREDSTDPQQVTNSLAAAQLSREALLPLRVDAAGDDVLALAAADGEAFVLSTRDRGEVARIPSQALQRVRIARAARRRTGKSAQDCGRLAMLVLPDGTKEDAFRRTLANLPAMTAAGESTVEGRKRLVVYGPSDDVVAAMKKLAISTARLVCGPAVIERDIEP